MKVLCVILAVLLIAVAFCVAWLVAVLRDGRRLRGMGWPN